MIATALSQYLARLFEQEKVRRPSFTWTQWAEEANVPSATLSRLKNGSTSDPQLTTIRMVLKPVGGSLEELCRMVEGLPLPDQPTHEPVRAQDDSSEAIRAAQADTAQRYALALEREKEERKAAYENHIHTLESHVAKLETQNRRLRWAFIIVVAFIIAALIALVVVLVRDANTPGWGYLNNPMPTPTAAPPEVLQ